MVENESGQRRLSALVRGKIPGETFGAEISDESVPADTAAFNEAPDGEDQVEVEEAVEVEAND